MINLMHAECVAAMRKLADRSVDHTTVACQELGRRFLGWEQERETYDKASARIKEAGKQQPLFAPKAAQATQLQLG